MKSRPSGTLISSIPVFGSLTEDETAAVARAGYLVSYGPGEVLFKQNTPVTSIIYICSGLVKLIRDADHRKKCILHLAGARGFTGLQAVFSDEPYQYSAVAVEDTVILMVDITVVRQIINQNGRFASAFLKQSSREGIGIMTKLLNQFYKQLPGRVAEMLLYFSHEIYKNPAFELPLSRQELAEFAGTTKESMIRTLSEFRHDKIIRLEGKKVEILSPEVISTLSRLG
jgi:CRP-like cAMP-binding protein